MDQESSTNSDDVDNIFSEKFKTKNPFVKLGTLMKIRKLINSLKTTEMEAGEKKLFLGIFSREQRRLMVKEDEKEQQREETIEELQKGFENDSFQKTLNSFYLKSKLSQQYKEYLRGLKKSISTNPSH